MSYTKSDWHLSDYPIQTRKNPTDDLNQQWVASILLWPGPIGVGATPALAKQMLFENFELSKQKKLEKGYKPYRPGMKVPIQFAPSGRIWARPDVANHFIEFALGFGANDPVFMSDESSLYDFGDEERVAEIKNNIRQVYGEEIAIPESGFIVDILEKISNLEQFS
jgi:hypothetical protein